MVFLQLTDKEAETLRYSIYLMTLMSGNEDDLADLCSVQLKMDTKTITLDTRDERDTFYQCHS